MVNSNRIANLGQRMVAFIIDMVVVTIVTGVVKSLIPNLVDDAIVIIYLFYFTFKDSIGGQSIGKRIAKIQVVVNADGRMPNRLRLVLRNVTFIFGVVDLIVAVINPQNRRIGDLAMGTCVVRAAAGSRLQGARRAAQRPVQGSATGQLKDDGLGLDLSKWDVLNRDLQFDEAPASTQHDHIQISREKKVDYNRDYIKENDWE